VGNKTENFTPLGKQVPKKLVYLWIIGLALRLIFINLATIIPGLVIADYVYYRLPIAQCILSEGWLYCDCTYNHTPFYPYLSAVMLWLAGDVEALQVFLINLPLGIGDALVPVAIFFLFRTLKNEKLAFLSSAFYALNPISLIEVGISHWDGFTLLFLLLGLIAIKNDQPLKLGVWTGMGFALKQFPLALFLIYFLKTRDFKSTFLMGIVFSGVVLLFFLPFILECSTTVFDNLLNHPLWKGKASVGTGTFKNVLEQLNIPNAKIVWAIIFIPLLVLPTLKVSNKNYLYYTGILMVTLAFFTYVTHRQLLIWCMPFLILITLERRSYIPFILVCIGYAIRIIKPEWYFGLVHLGVGVWYYIALYKKLIYPDNSSIFFSDKKMV